MKRVVLLIVSLLAVTAAGLWLAQRSLIYHPIQETLHPGSVALEEVRYETEDGLSLEAWWIEPEPARGLVIVFSGNGGNRSHRLPLALALNHLGYAVLLTDYRGYGGNPGAPSEEGLISDARAAAEYASSRKEVNRIAYFGESLGSAVATRLATEIPPAALILRSPPSSLVDVAAGHYPFLPVSLLLRDRFPVAGLMDEVGAPTLVIAGTEDRLVPAASSREVYDAAGEPKRLLEIEGARHNDLEMLAGAQMITAIGEFLESHLPDR